MAEERPIPGRIVDRGLRDHLWLLRQKIRGEPVTEPACRRCGYFVAGLTEPKCPECGADLERSGIIDPARVRPWPLRVIGIVLWTIVFMFLASRFTDQVVPRYFIDVAYLGIVDRSGDAPSINILAVSEPYLGWPWQIGTRPLESISLMTSPSADSQWPMLDLTVDLETSRFMISTIERPPPGGASTGADVEQGSYGGAETILRWMARAGLDTSDQGIVAQADEAQQIVQAARDTDGIGLVTAFRNIPFSQFKSLGGSYNANYTPTIRRAVIIWVGWIAIWLAGVALIAGLPARTVRRKRRAAPAGCDHPGKSA